MSLFPWSCWCCGEGEDACDCELRGGNTCEGGCPQPCDKHRPRTTYDARDEAEATRVFSNAATLWYLGAFSVNVIGG